MKVCLANDSFPPLIDGVSNAVVNYATIIERKYGKAIVATPKYPGVKDDYPFDVVRYASINTTKLVGYRTGYPFSNTAMNRLVEFKPDIIHSHCPMASTFLARELRGLVDVPLIFTYHTKFDIDIKRAVKLKMIQEPAIREVIRNIEACDEVWVVNRGAGENLKSLGYSGDYIVMPNGVDIDRSPADPALTEAINMGYSLPAGVPLFLFVGRVMWYKGLRTIIDSLRSLKDAGIDFRFAVVGNGDNFEEVKAYAAEQGISPECIFTGPIYDRALLKAWYARADLFLLPSVFDNNPLVVKEAAACSTASVLIRNSSSAEGVVDGHNGILIEDSAADMTRALVSLCAEPSKMREMGEKAAEELYVSWETSVEKAVARYGEVIAAYRSGEQKRQHVKYDNAIKFIGNTYKGLFKAKLVGENLRNGIVEQIRDVGKTNEEIAAWFRSAYNNIKDHFDRYQ